MLVWPGLPTHACKGRKRQVQMGRDQFQTNKCPHRRIQSSLPPLRNIQLYRSLCGSPVMRGRRNNDDESAETKQGRFSMTPHTYIYIYIASSMKSITLNTTMMLCTCTWVLDMFLTVFLRTRRGIGRI